MCGSVVIAYTCNTSKRERPSKLLLIIGKVNSTDGRKHFVPENHKNMDLKKKRSLKVRLLFSLSKELYARLYGNHAQKKHVYAFYQTIRAERRGEAWERGYKKPDEQTDGHFWCWHLRSCKSHKSERHAMHAKAITLKNVIYYLPKKLKNKQTDGSCKQKWLKSDKTFSCLFSYRREEW